MSGPNDITIKLGLDDTGLPQPVQRVNDAIATIGKTGEISARQTAAAMRTLPAQFTDIATQLAGGQNPLLILMQQGGQIKDSFGGVGPALSALGSYITPTAVAVAGLATGVGALALAAYQGRQEMSQLRDNIALTGNAAGLTGVRFTAVAEQVAAATQQTVGGAREIVMSLAANGQVSNRVLDAMATAVGRIADVTGTDSKKIAADFAGMAGGVAKWAAEHNKAWNFITLEQYKYIRGLEEQGKAEKAMLVTSELVTKHLADQQENLGTVEKAWAGVRKTASAAWDAMLNLGREETTRDKLEDATRRLQQLPLQGTGFRGLAERRAKIEEEIQLLKEQLKLEGQQADARSANAQRNRAAIAKEREDERKPKTEKEVPGPGPKEAAEAAAFRREQDRALMSQLRQEIEDDERRKRRLDRDAAYLQQMVDANDRAAIELIENQQQRGEALIRLARDQARRRLQAMGLEGGARDEALRLIKERANVALQAFDGNLRKLPVDKVGEDAGKATYDGVHGALTEAFRDTSDPLRAFGNALANTIFTRASRSLIDALATAAVGRDGQGGGLGALLSLFNAGGGGGGGTDAASLNSAGVDKFTNVPALSTGTNYVPRNMLAMLHEGEAVQPKRYNPAAGGAGGGMAITFAPQISIDSRTDREQVLGLVYSAVQQSQQAMVEDLQARGVMA